MVPKLGVNNPLGVIYPFSGGKRGVTEKKVMNSENQENNAVPGIRIIVNFVLVYKVVK